MIQLCGYFCIITSSEMSASDALDLYKSRDASEKDKIAQCKKVLDVCSLPFITKTESGCSL